MASSVTKLRELGVFETLCRLSGITDTGGRADADTDAELDLEALDDEGLERVMDATIADMGLDDDE
jgi:hypothetical protein